MSSKRLKTLADPFKSHKAKPVRDLMKRQACNQYVPSFAEAEYYASETPISLNHSQVLFSSILMGALKHTVMLFSHQVYQ